MSETKYPEHWEQNSITCRIKKWDFQTICRYLEDDIKQIWLNNNLGRLTTSGNRRWASFFYSTGEKMSFKPWFYPIAASLPRTFPGWGHTILPRDSGWPCCHRTRVKKDIESSGIPRLLNPRWLWWVSDPKMFSGFRDFRGWSRVVWGVLSVGVWCGSEVGYSG